MKTKAFRDVTAFVAAHNMALAGVLGAGIAHVVHARRNEQVDYKQVVGGYLIGTGLGLAEGLYLYFSTK